MVDPDDRSCLDDFVPHAPMPAASLARWGGRVPAPVAGLWRRWGPGMFLDGYLRVADPDEWFDPANLLHRPFWQKQPVIPFLATAFGDLVCWNPQLKLAETIQFRDGMVRGAGIGFFLANAGDPLFQRSALGMRGYASARRRLPVPGYGECYVCEPPACLGGRWRADRLRVAGMRGFLESIAAAGWRLDESTMRFPSR